MPATTVITIDIKDDTRASMRGKRFAAILRNPGTVRWVLQLLSPGGQMAEIAQFLREHEAARQPRSSEEARAVYMLASDTPGAETKTTVVDTALVSELIREKGRSNALAGGLRCERGHVMKFVDEHESRGSTVRAYFAHVAKSDAGALEAHRAPPAHTGPRCSDVHLLAQRYIQQNVNRIVATRFKSCGACVELAFRPSGNVRAEIEVTERITGGTIRSDVVVYAGDERLVAFEVKHTHGTEPTSRGGLPYLEVDAAHVVSQVEASASGARIVLKCENATTPCTRGCDSRRNIAEAEGQRPEWRQRLKEQLAAWVELSYESVPLHERDMGTPNHVLYSEYKKNPPHFKALNWNQFNTMVDSISEHIGPHWIEDGRDASSGKTSYALVYLLRRKLRTAAALLTAHSSTEQTNVGGHNERQLAAWVELNYEHVPLHESEMGTPNYELYSEYIANCPHFTVLGKSEFAKMLGIVYRDIRLWVKCEGTWGIGAPYKLCYLLRRRLSRVPPPSASPPASSGSKVHDCQAERDTTPGAELAEPTSSPREEDDADMYRRMRHEASLVRAKHRGICERQLRAWVESNYEHVPLHEKGLGTPLSELYALYKANSPHFEVLCKSEFAKMLISVYENIGPHGKAIYLLRNPRSHMPIPAAASPDARTREQCSAPIYAFIDEDEGAA
jgi:hypothetical protein